MLRLLKLERRVGSLQSFHDLLFAPTEGVGGGGGARKVREKRQLLVLLQLTGLVALLLWVGMAILFYYAGGYTLPKKSLKKTPEKIILS
jgi:hypothetical protein